MIYVDLDNTLIDSVGRYHKELAAAERYGISHDEYWLLYDVMNRRHGIGSFGYELFFQVIQDHMPGVSDTLLAEWRAILETQHPFPDTYEFLSSFRRDELILLTTGNPTQQRKKVQVHSFESYFSDIRIVGSPKCRHIEPPDGAIYIDDSPREIDEMKTVHPHVHCIIVRETPPWERRQAVSHKKDKHCRDLIEARDHIKQLSRPSE